MGARRAAFRVTCPGERAWYSRNKVNAAVYAVALLDQENYPDASWESGYGDGVAVWQRGHEGDWLALSPTWWIELAREATA